jgi:Fe2+ transport system protein FeoA
VRRLLALGITLGAEVEILHHRGHGVVVGRNGNRVALGKVIVDKLQAEKID